VSSDLSLSEARRIALAAQGFDRPRPRGRVDARHVRGIIRRLGLVQLDYVNVLLPAHYQILYSRLGPYRRSILDDLLYRRREFLEQWAHEASILPAESWPLLRHGMAAESRRPQAFASFMRRHAGDADRLLALVHDRGPLTALESSGPEANRNRRRDGWGWTHAKTLLEGHFVRGTLAVADRRSNFARVYDLTERVVPEAHLRRHVPPEEAQRELLLRAARAHGVGTAADLADYYRMSPRLARPRLAELVATDKLREVRVEGWRQAAYLHPEARPPKQVLAATLVSPFDPLVWYRPRTARLFDFEYRFEIFVPEAKRRWGCYVLPFLLGERLVARVDLKADRARRCLLVPAAYLETHAKAVEVAPALARELRTLAGWIGLESVTVGRRGNLARPLADVLRSR